MGKPQSWEVKSCQDPVAQVMGSRCHPLAVLYLFAAHLPDKEITSLCLWAFSYLSRACSFNHGATPWVSALCLVVSSALCRSVVFFHKLSRCGQADGCNPPLDHALLMKLSASSKPSKPSLHSSLITELKYPVTWADHLFFWQSIKF